MKQAHLVCLAHSRIQVPHLLVKGTGDKIGKATFGSDSAMS